MLPDEPGSSDWKAFFDECVRVGNAAICGNQGDLAREIYRCTFGIKRLAVELLKQAYIVCRSAARITARTICTKRPIKPHRCASRVVGFVIN